VPVEQEFEDDEEGEEVQRYVAPRGQRKPVLTAEQKAQLEAEMEEYQQRLDAERAAEAAAALQRAEEANAKRARNLENSNARAAMTVRSPGLLGAISALGKGHVNPIKHTALDLLDIMVKNRLGEAPYIIDRAGKALHFLTLANAPVDNRNPYYKNILSTFSSILSDMVDRTRGTLVITGPEVVRKERLIERGLAACEREWALLAPEIQAKADMVKLKALVDTARATAVAFYTTVRNQLNANAATAAELAAEAEADRAALQAEMEAQRELQAPEAKAQIAAAAAAGRAAGVHGAVAAAVEQERRAAERAGRAAAEAALLRQRGIALLVARGISEENAARGYDRVTAAAEAKKAGVRKIRRAEQLTQDQAEAEYDRRLAAAQAQAQTLAQSQAQPRAVAPLPSRAASGPAAGAASGAASAGTAQQAVLPGQNPAQQVQPVGGLSPPPVVGGGTRRRAFKRRYATRRSRSRW
jgi:hypothetical protein